jgi:hypothetical protein
VQDARFSAGAIASCLEQGGITLVDVDEAVFSPASRWSSSSAYWRHT